MTLRVATRADLPELGRVRMSVRENRLSDLSVLRSEDLDRVLTGSGRTWVCEVDDRIVGFAMADLEHANIYALFVDPAYERRGIGRRLHDTMMSWLFETGLPEAWLSTEPSTRAESFYRRAGWVADGITPKGEIRFAMARERWLVSKSGPSC